LIKGTERKTSASVSIGLPFSAIGENSSKALLTSVKDELTVLPLNFNFASASYMFFFKVVATTPSVSTDRKTIVPGSQRLLIISQYCSAPKEVGEEFIVSFYIFDDVNLEKLRKNLNLKKKILRRYAETIITEIIKKLKKFS
jgi:hypothetical protein